MWRPGCPNLKSNLAYARARLAALNKMKGIMEEVKKAYKLIFIQWIDAGYIVHLDQSEGARDDVWYLPHFPVIKPGKVRPVFDGHAEYKGQSLNSLVVSGPNYVGNLNRILL